MSDVVTCFRETLMTDGEAGGATVLGKLPVLGRPAIWNIVGQGPTALAVCAGGCCLDIFFSRLSFLFSYALSLGDVGWFCVYGWLIDLGLTAL